MAKKQTGISRSKSKKPAIFRNRLQNLKKLAGQLASIGNRIAKITERLDKIGQGLDILEEISANAAAGGTKNRLLESKMPGLGTCRIIPFQRAGPHESLPTRERSDLTVGSRALAPFLAAPGQTLPPQLPDFRPDLQRDGLILLAWDRRSTEMGDRYTAYWVTSAGTPRFYASRPLPSPDFSSARPDHKSYAAEDGIEFYGQDPPLYMVHVAPELMKSNPRHGELRPVHIKILKRQGSKVDFGHRYLLKTEKDPKLQSRNQAGRDSRRARA